MPPLIALMIPLDMNGPLFFSIHISREIYFRALLLGRRQRGGDLLDQPADRISTTHDAAAVRQPDTTYIKTGLELAEGIAGFRIAKLAIDVPCVDSVDLRVGRLGQR